MIAGHGMRTGAARVLVLFAVLLALGVAGAYLLFGLLTSSYTFACDFYAYAGAADRLLAGSPIYDVSVRSTGDCGIFQYPPPFVLAAIPFAVLDPVTGALAWITFLVACYVLAISAMPVRTEIRWAVGLLGAFSWPFIFGVRIGQVGPILLLLAALGWRWLDRPSRLGVTIGLGVLVKLQPAVIGLWLAARLEWRTAMVAGATVVAGTLIAAAVGLVDWIGFITLLRQLSDASTVPANLAIGAAAVKLGMPVVTAPIVQAAGTAGVVALVVAGARWATRETGYLAAVVGSQLASPILWDHYALALLLPVAFLLDRNVWWASLVPLAMAWVLLPFMPTLIYPAAYVTLLITLLVLGRRQRVGVASLAAMAA